MDLLGDRMKRYEAVSDFTLTRGLPCIVRLDGKGFHQWTRAVHAVKPFDENLHGLMTTCCARGSHRMGAALCGRVALDCA